MIRRYYFLLGFLFLFLLLILSIRISIIDEDVAQSQFESIGFLEEPAKIDKPDAKLKPKPKTKSNNPKTKKFDVVAEILIIKDDTIGVQFKIKETLFLEDCKLNLAQLEYYKDFKQIIINITLVEKEKGNFIALIRLDGYWIAEIYLSEELFNKLIEK